LGRRGVSEVAGVALISMIIAMIGLAWLAAQAPLLSMQAYGIIEQIRAVERRHRQLLSLLYYYRDGSGSLILYIYNYGLDNSTISRLFMGNGEVSLESITMKNAETNQPLQNHVIPPKTPAEVRVPGAPSGTYIVFLVTEEGGQFSWEVHV
jgi:hypothetical protein